MGVGDNNRPTAQAEVAHPTPERREEGGHHTGGGAAHMVEAAAVRLAMPLGVGVRRTGGVGVAGRHTEVVPRQEAVPQATRVHQQGGHHTVAAAHHRGNPGSLQEARGGRHTVVL